ncbi:MAG: Phosphoglycerate kinase [candidate division BRC1 bacterium ADurb.BinA292]|nr:MAG: Phosphoglycerate kinase [candidate division BRC1 bacterium ADurb.BinA292]
MTILYNKKSVEDLEVNGKRVFVRCDLNVPIENGQVANDRRIKASVPTIEYLYQRGGIVILASHLGRPKGERKPEMSLRPVAARLTEILGRPVHFAEDCIGEATEQQVAALKPREIILLENLRFHKEEEKNDPEFSKKLARLADVYVNDAFGTAHRAHASTEGITHHLSPCAAGFLIDKELKYLGNALAQPERPLLAILGGAKVGSKIGVITQLMKQVDTLVIGGGMAYTFLKVQGIGIGDSLFDSESAETARKILADAEQSKVKLVLPVDCVVADKFDNAANREVVDIDKIPVGWMGMDIGPRTIERIKEEVAQARTIVWNGPVGVFEMDNFAIGTRAVADAVAASKGVTVLGGGETAQAAEDFGVDGRMTHVSTGGGASLEFMEGRVLPGIAALDDK